MAVDGKGPAVGLARSRTEAFSTTLSMAPGSRIQKDERNAQASQGMHLLARACWASKPALPCCIATHGHDLTAAHGSWLAGDGAACWPTDPW